MAGALLIGLGAAALMLAGGCWLCDRTIKTALRLHEKDEKDRQDRHAVNRAIEGGERHESEDSV